MLYLTLVIWVNKRRKWVLEPTYYKRQGNIMEVWVSIFCISKHHLKFLSVYKSTKAHYSVCCLDKHKQSPRGKTLRKNFSDLLSLKIMKDNFVLIKCIYNRCLKTLVCNTKYWPYIPAHIPMCINNGTRTILLMKNQLTIQGISPHQYCLVSNKYLYQ